MRAPVLLAENRHPSKHPIFAPRHGTRKPYEKGCRCARCHEAGRRYEREKKRRRVQRRAVA